MRTISPTTMTVLQQTNGASPYNIVEIQWVRNGQFHAYSDIEVPGVKSKILSLGQVQDLVTIDNGPSVKQVELTLDDADSEIKAIFDSTDIHKRDCCIYQAFTGLATSEKFLIFKGQISSPISWDEGARTLSFSVISKVDDAEVGFSIEEGQFSAMPEDLIGQPWPLVFGSVVNSPALRITSPREGTLAKSFGIRDFTLDARLKLANNLYCLPNYQTGVQVVTDENGQNPQTVPKFSASNDCAQRKCSAIEQIKLELKQQKLYEYDTIVVYGGTRFQQGQLITIQVGGAYLTGRFTGNDFQIIKRLHPDIVELGVNSVEEAIAKLKEVDSAGEVKSKCTILTAFETINDKSANSFNKLNNHPTSNFAWISAGETVTFAYDESAIYIANILPTSITRVSAFRTINGQRRLLTIPQSYYSIRMVDYTSYTATEIVFPRPLSLLGEDWEEDIFVCQTSTVGPNTVDIMRWLIDTYTDFDIDETSFAAVRAKIDTYPMHFAMLERKNIMTMLQEMAFQARCVIYLQNDKFYIKYLSEEPTPVDTITEDDIERQTLQIMTTSTEELVTKLTTNWQDDYSKDQKKLILRQNVSKYGTQTQDFDFYAYNLLMLVNKSAIYWLIRKSNTWKRVKFKTAIHKLKLEAMDAVTLNLPDLADSPVIGIIESATFDSATNQIEFEVWTTVLAGTRVAYPFAFPSSADETLEWPTDSEIDEGLVGSGEAPGFKTIAPPGHQLSSVTNNITNQGDEITYQVDQTCGQPRAEGSIGYSFCCESTLGLSEVPGYCNNKDKRKTNDKEDKKPDPKDESDTSGDINTGKDPKFADGSMAKIKAAKEKADKAEEAAQKANDVANGANEAAGGPGSSSDETDVPENPYEQLPEPGETENPPVDPDDERPTCKTIITVSWFPIKGIPASGGGVNCIPDGPTVVETFEYAGAGMCDKMPEPACDGGYNNGPCCHVFMLCISPDPETCAPGTRDGELIGYKSVKKSPTGEDLPYDGLSWNQPGSGGVEPGAP